MGRRGERVLTLCRRICMDADSTVGLEVEAGERGVQVVDK